MLEPNKEHIDELIAGFLSKGATPEEERVLLEWIESDMANRKYYRQMYRTWLSSAQVGQLEMEHERQALRQVCKKAFDISVAGKRRQDHKAHREIQSWKFLKYAAAIAILMIGTYSITRYSMNRRFDSQMRGMTYEAHYGSRAFAALPDGSKVWLNSGSKLTISQDYDSDDRRVELSGEAYFDVETNPSKPFIVKAGELSIKAAGTTFNVKAYPDEEQIFTTLVEGIVFIEGYVDREKEFKIKMTPNQTVSYKRQAIIKSASAQADTIAISHGSDGKKSDTGDFSSSIPATVSLGKTEALTSWMKDRWMIDNENFGRLATQLERRYNVEIRFASEELKQYRFTGTIERETIEQMFDAFRYSIPLKYSIDKGTIILSMDRELERQYEKAWKR